MKILKNELKSELNIRTEKDFPKKGIEFIDIMPLIIQKETFNEIIEKFAKEIKCKEVDYIVGPEARGFIFGVPVAYALGVGFVPVRKPGKLPYETISMKYDLEYGQDELQIHKDAIKPGQRVAIIDDLLATGGTILACCKLVERLGGIVAGIGFVIELQDLKGREVLKDYNVYSLIKY